MSKITWTDETWNCVTGCSRVSAGCEACFAERLTATRLKHLPQYKGLATIVKGKGARWSGEVRCHPGELDRPLHWRDPRKVFVCSMGDLFHMDVPDEFIDRVFATMAIAHRHTFQVLTKRPARMTACLANTGDLVGAMLAIQPNILECDGCLPLSNVWLGTSVEDQKTFDERVPHLLKCPAAVRFLSIEPLLGSIAIGDIKGIDWVIIGCESKGVWNGRTSSDVKDPVESRMCWEARANNIITRCLSLGIKVFVKQIPGLDGKVIKDMAKFPKSLQFQQYPKT